MSDDKEVADTKVPATPSGAIGNTVEAPAANGERFHNKVLLAVIVAALTFLGSVGGALLTLRLETNKWVQETSYSQRKEILTKRMELLERSIKIINHLQTLDMYKGSVDYSLMEGEAAIKSNKSAARSLEPVVENFVKVKEAQAELSVTLTLDTLYFGPKSKQAISELNSALKGAPKWWDVDEAKTQKVIDALYEELTFGLT